MVYMLYNRNFEILNTLHIKTKHKSVKKIKYKEKPGNAQRKTLPIFIHRCYIDVHDRYNP